MDCEYIEIIIQMIAFLRSVVPSCKSIAHKNTYHYLTPIEKPFTSLAINSIVELSASSIVYCYDEFGMMP